MANVLPFALRVDVASHLVDGCSVNATSRLTRVYKQTILDFLVLLGESCARLHDRLVRGVVSSDVEMDEIWSFVGKKPHRCGPNDPSEWGDNYTFGAMGRASLLVISYLTGPRDGPTTFVFAYDLKKRLVTTPGRVQVSSDGVQPYIPAMRAAFGLRVDYGQVVKQYSAKQKDDHRYEPPRDADFIKKTPILGVPKFERMGTSLVERQNLTSRIHVRRLTRLCNDFSKKRRNHGAALALHFAWYNFCRIHESLRVTPAMAAGLSDHVWEIEELVSRLGGADAGAHAASPDPVTGRLAPAGAARTVRGASGHASEAAPAKRRRHPQRQRQRGAAAREDHAYVRRQERRTGDRARSFTLVRFARGRCTGGLTRPAPPQPGARRSAIRIEALRNLARAARPYKIEALRNLVRGAPQGVESFTPAATRQAPSHSPPTARSGSSTSPSFPHRGCRLN